MNEFLIGGVGMLVISILLAWLVTFSRIFAESNWAQHVDEKIILKGHIDFVLMSLFSFAFWATHIPVPKFAMWTMLIGGYTNPGIFLWLGLLKNAWSYSFVRVYVYVTFILTTVGFFAMGYYYLRYALA